MAKTIFGQFRSQVRTEWSSLLQHTEACKIWPRKTECVINDIKKKKTLSLAAEAILSQIIMMGIHKRQWDESGSHLKIFLEKNLSHQK